MTIFLETIEMLNHLENRWRSVYGHCSCMVLTGPNCSSLSVSYGYGYGYRNGSHGDLYVRPSHACSRATCVFAFLERSLFEQQ